MSEKRYQKYKVHNPHGKDFEFEGIKLGEKSHGKIGTIEVYKTKGGKWVTSQKHDVMKPNRNLSRAGVFDDEEELLEWLGPSKPAKELAHELGLTNSVWVD